MINTGHDDSGDSEVVFLPATACPACGGRNVVAEIAVGRMPVLSCTACGHTSATSRQPSHQSDAAIDPPAAALLRAGAVPPTSDNLVDVGLVHAIDGDGSSLCDIIDPGGLVPVDHYRWPDVPTEQRCPVCSIRMSN
jgi:Zn ribbon nucleic-acid-binding protein